MFELRLDVEVAAGSLRSLERKREATPEIAEPAACTAPSSRVPVPKEFSLVGKSAAEVSALAGQVSQQVTSAEEHAAVARSFRLKLYGALL